MKSTLIAALMLLGTGLCYAEAEAPASFLGEDAQSARAQDFYRSRCDTLANEQVSNDSERPAFMASCIKDMTNIWPLGYDESAD
jgi:hypothetical protein